MPSIAAAWVWFPPHFASASGDLTSLDVFDREAPLRAGIETDLLCVPRPRDGADGDRDARAGAATLAIFAEGARAGPRRPAHQRGALHRVAQLAHVAGPLVPEEDRHRVARDRRRRASELARRGCEEHLRERLELGPSLAERRIVRVTPLSRNSRSRRNVPRSVSRSMSRFVADTKRTSIGIATRPPTRITFRSSRTRRSFTWVASGMSPISSRNTVPLPADSRAPAWPDRRR